MTPATRAIIHAVADRHGVHIRDLLSRDNRRPYAWARQAAMYEVYTRRPHLSYPAVGRIFGRDHTTVMHAVRAHCRRNGIDFATIRAGCPYYHKRDQEMGVAA